jgi:Flp pilus assembly protein TadB
MTDDPSHDMPSQHPNWSHVNQWLLWLGLAAAVAWLVLRHGAHLLEIAPFLIVLACPLMHLSGHGGHGSHGSDGSHDGSRKGD